MSRTRVYILLIGIISLICLFSSLGATRLWDEDEGFFASTAAEMYARGDWIVPYFNGDVFGHKPPWMYWMMMSGFQVFGVNELGARFFSAVFGTATALLTFQLGRRLFNDVVGFFAGLILPTCLMFSVVARAATPDIFLVFFSTLALYLFAVGGFASQKFCFRRLNDTSIRSMLPSRWSVWVALYAVMGLAVLVKGPIGFLFPMAVIGLFLLVMTPPRVGPAATLTPMRAIWEKVRPFGPVNFIRTVWIMRPLTAAITILLIAGPWYLAVGIMTEGVFLSEFFGVHHFQRFTTPMENHNGPFYYYVVAILAGMFPWSVLAVPVAIEWFHGQKEPSEHNAALRFLACWAGVYIVIFSIASTKLPNYVLPAYPALAVLGGVFLDRAIRSPQRRHVLGVAAGAVAMMIVGGTIVVGVPSIPRWFSSAGQIFDQIDSAALLRAQLAQLALLGIPAVLGGFTALWLIRSHSLLPAIGSTAVACIATVAMIWNFTAPRVDQLQAAQDIASRVGNAKTASADSIVVGSYQFFRPSMVFYAGQEIEQLHENNAAARFLLSDGQRFLITNSRGYESLKPIHARLEIVAQKPNFLQPGKLMLLRNRASIARVPEAERR